MQFPTRGTLHQIEEGATLQPLFDERGLIPCVTRHAANVERIARMAEENDAAAQRNQEVARRLDGLSGELRDASSRYRIA